MWEIMINNFGHVRVDICKPVDSAAIEKEFWRDFFLS